MANMDSRQDSRPEWKPRPWTWNAGCRVTEKELSDENSISPSSCFSDEEGYYPGQEYIQRKEANSKTNAEKDVSSVHKSEPSGVSWRPSILRIGPLVGIAALLFGVVQVIAAYAVLVAADGDRISHWKIQPTVYLAVLTAISNKALSFAVIQGTVITWWLKASRSGGTTLAQMQRDWGYGMHTYKALLAGRHFNILALACICATFVAIDGPLLQRASSVVQRPANFNVSISPEVPAYSTGWVYLPSTNLDSLDYQHDFLPVAQSYIADSPIRSDHAIVGCDGKCSGAVRAPALVVEHCESSLKFRNLSKPLTDSETTLAEHGYPPKSHTTLDISFNIFNGSTEQIVVETSTSDASIAKTCSGHLKTTKCFLSPATAEYSIVVSDGIISFEGGKTPSHPNIIARANDTALTEQRATDFDLYDPPNWIKTTLSGIAQAASVKWYATYGLAVLNGTMITMPLLNPLAQELMTNYEAWDNQLDCAPAWKDPQDKILSSLNQLMFRTGVHAAQTFNETYLKSRLDPGLEISYSVEGSPPNTVNVFKSNFSWFAAAAVMELFTISSIAFTFWGYWRLGRHVSFSPVDLAKAFDAPLLPHPASGSRRSVDYRNNGSARVRYGIVRNDHAEEKMVIGEAQQVQQVSGEPLNIREQHELLISRFSLLLQKCKLLRPRKARQTPDQV